jgi:hypothetical protein
MSKLIVKNLAIGGTTTAYWAENIKRHITPNVNHLAFYCGSNDINQGVAEKIIINQTLTCFEILKTINSSIKISYFSIMKSPQKYNFYNEIDNINNSIKNELGEHLYINLNTIINNDPIWYLEDQLHLKQIAYQKMEETLSPTLRNWVFNET